MEAQHDVYRQRNRMGGDYNWVVLYYLVILLSSVRFMKRYNSTFALLPAPMLLFLIFIVVVFWYPSVHYPHGWGISLLAYAGTLGLCPYCAGAFLYSRSRDLSPAQMLVAADVIRGAGLDPNDFCKVRNTCFLQQQQGATTSATTTTTVAAATSKGESSSISLASVGSLGDEEDIPDKEVPFWFLGQRFFKASRAVAQELADWFEDPTLVSDWLVSQQEKMVLQQPLVRVLRRGDTTLVFVCLCVCSSFLALVRFFLLY